MKAMILIILLSVVPVQHVVAEPSCLAATGRANSARLVQECRSISEATHPPCNAMNSCTMIIQEIVSWCEINRKSRLNYKSFCKNYPANLGLPED